MVALILRLWTAVRAYFRQELSYESLFNFTDVSAFIQTHLKKVYLTIFGALICFSIGYELVTYCNVGSKVLGFIGFIGGFVGSFVGFCITPPGKEVRRVCLLMAAAFCKGASFGYLVALSITSFKGAFISSLIDLLIRIDKAVAGLFKGSIGRLILILFSLKQGDIFSALSGAAVAFGYFALGARISLNRLEIYLFGALASAYTLFLWLLFTSASWQLYLGFGWFLGYVVAYSQKMVAEVRRGSYHYTQHSIRFFTDIVPVTYLIGLIMLRRARTKFANWVNSIQGRGTTLLYSHGLC